MPTNLFAGVPAAVVAKTTVSFAAAGITAANTRIIFEVDDELKSFMPGRALNAIFSFEEGKDYYIYPIADMDLSAILAPPLLMGLENVVDTLTVNDLAGIGDRQVLAGPDGTLKAPLVAFTELEGTEWDGTWKAIELTEDTDLTFVSSLQTGYLRVTQDATGGRALTINGTPVDLNTGANELTYISAIYNNILDEYDFLSIGLKGDTGGDPGGGAAVRSFNSVADLKESTYHENYQDGFGLTVQTVGYYEAGDGGAATYAWDPESTETADNRFIIQADGVDDGRWILAVENNTVNILQIGARADQDVGSPVMMFTDNYPIIQAAINRVIDTTNSVFNIYIPAGANNKGYFVGTKLETRGQCAIYGDARPEGSRSVLVFPVGVSGIETYPPAGINWGGQVILKDLMFRNNPPAIYQEDGYIHGVIIHTVSQLDNVFVYGFKGDGIRITANLANTGDPNHLTSDSGGTYTGSSTASNSVLTNCFTQYNAGNGYYIRGGDTNVILFQNCAATANKYYGFYDHCFLGCTFIGCVTHNNSLYQSGTAPSLANTSSSWAYTGDIVSYGTPTRFYLSLQNGNLNHAPTEGADNAWWKLLLRPDGAYATEPPATFTITPWSAATTYEKVIFYKARIDSTNQAPPAVGHSIYWSNLGDDADWNLARKWNNVDTYRGGGAAASLHASNMSVWVGLYTEAGQGHTYFNGGAANYGGLQETPMFGNYTYAGVDGILTSKAGFGATAFSIGANRLSDDTNGDTVFLPAPNKGLRIYGTTGAMGSFLRANGQNLASAGAINPGVSVYNDGYNIAAMNLGYMAGAYILSLFSTGYDFVFSQAAGGITDNSSLTERFRIEAGTGNAKIGGKLRVGNLPTYADDAAAGAGGLVTGEIYKTSTGEIRGKL